MWTSIELQSTTTQLDFRLTTLELSTNASVGGLESRVGILEETTIDLETRLTVAEIDIDGKSKYSIIMYEFNKKKDMIH